MWLGTSDLVPPNPKGQGYSFQVLELEGNRDLVQQFDVLKQQSPIQILTQNSNSQKKAFLLQTEVEHSASHYLGILPHFSYPFGPKAFLWNTMGPTKKSHLLQIFTFLGR